MARPHGSTGTAAPLTGSIRPEIWEQHLDHCARSRDSVLTGRPLPGVLRWDPQTFRWTFQPDDADLAVQLQNETLPVTVL